LTFGSQAEGCVFDDVAGHLYIAVEDSRIDRFAANPDEGDTPVTIASVDGRTAFADLEGVTLFEREGQSPLLIASSQGNSSFLVYDTANSALIGRFRIGAGPNGDLDAVTETDGIAVLSGSVEGFSGGLFIAQDDVNLQASGRTANQNYKFVAWSDIETALSR
jgi:3-phytase